MSTLINLALVALVSRGPTESDKKKIIFFLLLVLRTSRRPRKKKNIFFLLNEVSPSYFFLRARA
jgi:hypothetical protein